MNENNVPADDWRPFGLTVEAALNRGDDPAMLLDENSPIRDELRRLLAAPVAQPPATAEAVDCEACLGSSVRGFRRGVKCLACDGSGTATQPPAPVQQTEAVAEEASELTRSTYGVGLIKFCAPETALRYLAKRLREAGIDSSIADDYAQSIEFLLARRDDLAADLTPPAPALPPVAMVPLTEALVLEMADFLRELCKHSDAMVPIQGPRSDIASDHYERARHLIARSAHGIEASTGEQSHG